MYGNIVKVYCYERVICDFIKNRKNIDSETYVKAICSYKKYNKRDLDALYEIAEKMKILNKVIELMELVYE
jgi:N6-adenosine-specific RNA methylase IME4